MLCPDPVASSLNRPGQESSLGDMVESGSIHMIAHLELQQLLSVHQRLGQLQAFASALGWNGLTLCHHVISDEDMIRFSLQTQVILWYETPDPRFGLQINIHPRGQLRHYQAIVKAERYGISV